jgi:mannose-6-phosphate isomerase-like protein (cupin superfamily)
MLITPQKIDKKWGSELIIYNKEYCLKLLTVNSGWQSSLHYHGVKDEVFYIASGVCDLEVNEYVHRLLPGETFHLPPGTRHRFRAINEPCYIVEASNHHDDADVYRLEESRKT